MKKTYKQIRACVAVCGIMALSSSAFAQISGTVTIDAQSGTTPGVTYQSFNALATALNTSGINGPLTVNVLPGTGPYVEQVALNQITGMSSINRITINGNGNLLTFNGTSGAAHTLWLNGTDNLVVNDLQIQGTNSTYAMVCVLTNNADNNTFSSCSFSCPANGTSSSHVPWSISANNNYPSQNAPCDFNTVNTSTLFGGYYSIFHGGTYNTPYTQGNTFRLCTIRDWYYYGVYSDYARNFTVSGCDFSRPTRTTLTSTNYFWYGWYAHGCTIEENTFHDFWGGNTSYSGTLYGWYYWGYGSPAPSERNQFRNNIVRDMKWNGSIYLFYYNYNTNNDYYNNTFSWDYTQTTTGSTYIFYYCYPSGGNINTITNNIFSCTKPGSGTWYGLYFQGNTGVPIEDNNHWVTSTNAYIGNYTGANATTMAQWQAQGVDLGGTNLNPMYYNVALGDLEPSNPALNNLATPMGLIFDNRQKIRNQSTPDVGAIEFLTPLCAGMPDANSITGPNYTLCPGETANLGLANWPSTAGLTYQWQSSTISNVGPFTNLSGQTGLFYNTPPINQNTYYSVVITCTAAGNVSIAPVISLVVGGPTVGTVPYYENFETVGKKNRLPNCSWSASHLGDRNQTYPAPEGNNRLGRNGSASFAAFSNASPGTSYFYTHPIQMNTGITYSAAVHWATEYFGYNNWSNLAILVGPNQSSVGLVQVASINNPINGQYQKLDNTFTVSTSGLHYVAIRATSASGNALYLMIDDLSITIPCQPGSPNSPTVSVAASNATICQNDPQVSLTATGADTYSWSTGDQNFQIFQSPSETTNYVVYGTNALTGCTSSMITQITVNKTPTITVFANNTAVCPGQPVTLSAFGADNYVWNPAGQGQNITVTPNGNTTYTVSGTWNGSSCAGKFVQSITVKPTPTVIASSSNENACVNDMLSLTAFGGVSFQWYSNTSPIVYQGNIINISGTNLGVSNTVFTVVATGANGCTGSTTLQQNLFECVGIANISGANGVRIYPNPTAGEFNVEFNTATERTVNVTDVTGRVIISEVTSEQVVDVNLNNLANGIYYVKIQSENNVQVVKIVKQ